MLITEKVFSKSGHFRYHATIHSKQPPYFIVLYASSMAETIETLTRSSARATTIVIIIVAPHMGRRSPTQLYPEGRVGRWWLRGAWFILSFDYTAARQDENIHPVYFISFKAASNERPIGLNFVNNKSRKWWLQLQRAIPPFVISYWQKRQCCDIKGERMRE